MSYVALFISEQKYLTHFCHQTELRKKQKAKKNKQKIVKQSLKKKITKQKKKTKGVYRLYLAFDEVILESNLLLF